jgi:short-subunit dehydrogenase
MTSTQTQGTALVTGASSGIGAVYAQRLAARGFDLLLVARDQQRLDEAASTLRAEHGVQVEVLKADLTQKDDVLKLEQRLRSDSSISLLLNNAGVAADGLLANADTDQLERMIQLNVTTVTRLASAAAASFAKAGSGDHHQHCVGGGVVSRAFQRNLQRQQSLCVEPDPILERRA